MNAAMPEFDQIKADYARGALAHAFLALSPNAQLLDEFYKEFCGLVAGGSEFSAAKIAANSHPDIFVYPREGKRQLQVADVEHMLENIMLKPAEAEAKVFIFRAAETMNKATQNKLLKTLEEPPRNVYILLLARQNMFLPTINSRVFKINLTGELFNRSRLETDENFKKNFDLVLKTLSELNSSREVAVYSRNLAARRDSASEILEIFEIILYDIFEAHTNGRKSKYPEVAARFNLKTIAYVIGALKKAKSKIKFNCSNAAVFDCLLLEILEVKYNSSRTADASRNSTKCR